MASQSRRVPRPKVGRYVRQAQRVMLQFRSRDRAFSPRAGALSEAMSRLNRPGIAVVGVVHF
jgi:hypothetical protein